MKKIALAAIPALLASTTALASGFALNEQSATTQGTAGAGSGVENAASVQFTNPAGLAFLKGTQVVGGGTVYFTHGTFSNTGSSSLLGAAGPALSGVSDATTSPTVVAPHLYISQSVTDDLVVGVGISAPYGLKTAYESDSIVRYFAETSELRTIDINPNIAYKALPNFSVGAGLIIRHSDATFTNAIDFGSIGAANHIPGSIPQKQDGFAQVRGDDWAYGYKLGLEFLPFDGTKVGVSFTSDVSTTLTGDATFATVGPGKILSALTGQFVNTGATAALDYPEKVALSVSQAITPKWTVMGDLSFTHWSNFQELRVHFANPKQADTVTSEKWDDTWRISLGTTYDVTDSFTLRAGFSYDQTPVPGPANLTPRVPDADRYWSAIGLGYKFSDQLAVNAAYAHLMFDDAQLQQQSLSAGTLVGNYSGTTADLLTIDVSYKF
jgi:long-chain fatty acid transport protein